MQNVIGFTRSGDDCVEGYDVSYSESLSGLYLNELQGLSLRILDSLHADGEIWDRMTIARDAAITTFKQEVFTEILKYNEYIRPKFIGEIGRRNFNKALTKYSYHGLRLFSELQGATFTLRGITLNLNTSEIISLDIYNDFELLYTIENLQSAAGKPYYNAIDAIEIELNGNYYFIYSPTGSPMNNNLTCGCGGHKWYFNPDNPKFLHSREGWTQWVMAAGITGEDVDERDSWGISSYAQGLRLHGDFKCDASAILCSESSDFENDEIDRAIAFAILYKTGQYMIMDIMNSGEVSRWTLLGKADVLPDLFNMYSGKYSEMINFIAEHIGDKRNDCLQCKRKLNKTKQYI